MLYTSSLFAATPDKIEGDGGIWHLAIANPVSLSITVYAITLVQADGTTAELFYDVSGEELDLVTNSGYTSLVNATAIPEGVYTELRLYISYTVGLKGYVHYQYDGYVEEPGRYYYTKEGTTHEDILGQTELMADTGFPNPSDYAAGGLVMESGE